MGWYLLDDLYFSFDGILQSALVVNGGWRFTTAGKDIQYCIEVPENLRELSSQSKINWALFQRPRLGDQRDK